MTFDYALGNENLAGHQGLFAYRLTTGDAVLGPDTIRLYYNRNRWYSPNLGRFLQKDPIATSQVVLIVDSEADAQSLSIPSFDPMSHYAAGQNLFQYNDSNPVVMVDPSGQAAAFLYLLGGLGLYEEEQIYDAQKNINAGAAINLLIGMYVMVYDTRIMDEYYASEFLQHHVPPQGALPGIPGTRRVKSKTHRARWKDANDFIYEWDYKSGAVEKWDKRAKKHLGEYDPNTGQQTKPPDPTKKPPGD